jgi:hypothetical protein
MLLLACPARSGGCRLERPAPLLFRSPVPVEEETQNVIRAATRLLVVAVLAVLALPGGAMANPIRDCNDDGDLDKRYSNAELRKALDELPTDLDEYSNCREILSGAISGGSDKGGNRPTAGADGSPLTPREQAARTEDAEDLAAITADPEKNPPSIEVGGEQVEPGSDGLFDLATASNDLPAPLLVSLIALLVVALVGGLAALRERIPALARIPLLSKIPTPRVSFPRFWR